VALRNLRPNSGLPLTLFPSLSFFYLALPGFRQLTLDRWKKKLRGNTDVGSDQELWTGITAPATPAGDIEREHEYSDEEQLATVTIVENFDPSVLLYHKPDAEQQQQRPLLTLPLPLPLPSSCKSQTH
jgi:hypothetical protein